MDLPEHVLNFVLDGEEKEEEDFRFGKVSEEDIGILKYCLNETIRVQNFDK